MRRGQPPPFFLCTAFIADLKHTPPLLPVAESNAECTQLRGIGVLRACPVLFHTLLNAGIKGTRLLRDGSDLNGCVDHREGRQHRIEVSVDQVSDFGHGKIQSGGFFDCQSNALADA